MLTFTFKPANKCFIYSSVIITTTLNRVLIGMTWNLISCRYQMLIDSVVSKQKERLGLVMCKTKELEIYLN